MLPVAGDFSADAIRPLNDHVDDRAELDALAVVEHFVAARLAADLERRESAEIAAHALERRDGARIALRRANVGGCGDGRDGAFGDAGRPGGLGRLRCRPIPLRGTLPVARHDEQCNERQGLNLHAGILSTWPGRIFSG